MKLSLMSLVVGVVPSGLHNYGVDLASTRCVLSIPPETIVKEALELCIFSSEVEAPIVAHGKEESPYCSPW